MHSTELMIVIPLLIVLIITTMMMLYFATVLSQAELSHSRVFMMALTEQSEINHQIVKPNIRDVINHQPIGLKTHAVFVYDPKVSFNNPFSLLNNKSQFNLQLNFKMTEINRKWISIINSGVEDFFQSE